MVEHLPRFTDDAFYWLRKHVEDTDHMEYYSNPDADFGALLNKFSKEYDKEYLVETNITVDLPLGVVPPKPGEAEKTADAQALRFYDKFDGMTPKRASDPRIMAYLNLFHLHKYGTLRWPGRNNDPKQVLKHWLGEDSRALYEYSVSGRLWWIAHVAITSADESDDSFKAEEALKKFVETAEYYHRSMQYNILKNPFVRSECVRALLNEADGISREGYKEIVRDLNRQAGAKLLDVLERGELQKIVKRSVAEKMRNGDYVPDRKNVKDKKKLKVLSLGAGAQSTALALMAEEGFEGLEKPDLAIFADTHWEPPNVYEHLDWLEKQLSYEVVRVSAGDIRENILNGVNSTGDKFLDVPVFIVNKNGSKGIAARQCTTHYKINPIRQELRKRLGIPYGRRAPKDIEVEMWMGITTDEALRMKPSKIEWITNRYPLIEMDLSRANIYNWFEERHPGRRLPRSACIGCPYHSDMEWKWLRDNQPGSFKDAVYVDWAMRNVPKARGTIKGTAFLHHDCKPLDQVDFDSAEDYDAFMNAECEGLCGV